MKFFALKHIISNKFYGILGQDEPMETRYYLYNQDVAEQRRMNMPDPRQWITAESPRQTNWVD